MRTKDTWGPGSPDLTLPSPSHSEILKELVAAVPSQIWGTELPGQPPTNNDSDPDLVQASPLRQQSILGDSQPAWQNGPALPRSL